VDDDRWLNRIGLGSLGLALLAGVIILGIYGYRGVTPPGEFCTVLGGIAGAIGTSIGQRIGRRKKPPTS
jgi:hypothetical protein